MATVQSQAESANLTFHLLQENTPAAPDQAIAGSAAPFLYHDLLATYKIPATLAPGPYSWRIDNASHATLAAGAIQIKLPAPASQPITTAPAPYTNALGMTFLPISPGSFVMGSSDPDASPDEQPPHTIHITHPFFMAKYLVTNAQFRKFNPNYHDHSDNHHFVLPIQCDLDNQPVKTTHNTVDAEAFIAWLNTTDTTKPAGLTYQFPTEAQWEYAARGPQNFRYPWGNTWNSNFCNFGNQACAQDNLPAQQYRTPTIGPAPIGSFSLQGDSPFGITDMAGGLWQWCQDTYDPAFYDRSPADDPVNFTITNEAANLVGEGSEKIKHVLRGGSWGSLPSACRSTFRYLPNSTHNPTIGIRLVLAPAATR